MRRMLFLATVLFGTASLSWSATAWVNAPGGVAIAVDPADNVFTVAWDYNPAGDITITKRNADGAILWERRYDNTDTTRHEVATWVATDLAGNAVVTGTIRSGYSSPVNAASLVMKYSPDGQLLWRRVFDSSFDGSSTRKALVDAAGNIYVLGLGVGPSGLVTRVKKFAPDGTALWSYFDAAGIGAPVNFKFTPDGHIVIAGRGITGAVNGYAKITRDGAAVWSLGALSLTAGDVAGDALGQSYVVHGDYAAGSGTVIKKLSPAGAVVWQRTVAMSAFRVDVGPDDLPIISGFPNAGTGGAAFMKFDAAGNTLWANLDADGPSYALLMHGQMLIDGHGNAYLSGGTLFEMAVCRVNADGSTGWTQTAPGNYTAGFALGSDDSVYAVGGLNAVKFTDAPPPAGTDLALTLTASAASVTVGQPVTYTITVRNLGPAPATAVTTTGSLPACNAASLAVGASVSCSSTVTPTNTGTLIHAAQVLAAQPDPVAANNSASVTTTVVPAGADLALTLTDAPDPVTRGGRLTYTIVVQNAGPSAAAGVTVSDVLPAGVSLLSRATTQGTCAGSPTITCTVGTLAAGARATVTIVVRPRTTGSLTNVASVSATTPDGNSGNNTAVATTLVRR